MNTITSDLVEHLANKERENEDLKNQIAILKNRIESTIALINQINEDSISGEFYEYHLKVIKENLKTGKNSY